MQPKPFKSRRGDCDIDLAPQICELVSEWSEKGQTGVANAQITHGQNSKIPGHKETPFVLRGHKPQKSLTINTCGAFVPPPDFHVELSGKHNLAIHLLAGKQEGEGEEGEEGGRRKEEGGRGKGKGGRSNTWCLLTPYIWPDAGLQRTHAPVCSSMCRLVELETGTSRPDHKPASEQARASPPAR